MSYFCSIKTFIYWFKMNDMIVNPEKFQAVIMSCYKIENKYDLNINNSIISSEKHIFTICTKASKQLITTSQIQSYIDKTEK